MITAIDCIIGAIRDYLDGFYDITGFRGLVLDIIAEIRAIF